MTKIQSINDPALSDLAYLKDLAQAGEQAPLVGGPCGLMWGILLTVTFAGQWAILSGTINTPARNLMFLWIAFAVIGGIGSAILGRRVVQKPGAGSTANRVDSYVWVMFAGMMATLFIGVLLSNFLGTGTPQLYDLIVIVGFAGQGLAYGVVAKISKIKWIQLSSLAGFVASAICFTAFGSVNLYLIAAIATVFTVIVPSLISMRHEPAHVI